MSFDRKMIALAAAVADLESPAELLAGVELLAAHAGRLGGKDGAAPITTVPGVIALKLGGSLAEFRKAFWEVERLAVPDMSSNSDGAGVDSPSGQLTALLPLVQGISYPEVAMRLVEEIGTLATHRMRGQWSPLWYEVRGRVASALAGDSGGNYAWRNGAFEVVESDRDYWKRFDTREATSGVVRGADSAVAGMQGPPTVATVRGERTKRSI